MLQLLYSNYLHEATLQCKLTKITLPCQNIFCLLTKISLTKLYKPRAYSQDFMVHCKCAVPENIHTPPTAGRFLFCTPPPPPQEIPVYFNTLLLKLKLLRPPSPQEFPIIFHGVGMDFFRNYTIINDISDIDE